MKYEEGLGTRLNEDKIRRSSIHTRVELVLMFITKSSVCEAI